MTSMTGDRAKAAATPEVLIMSWGDQILDELGLVDIEKRSSRSKLDPKILHLYVFALWLAKRHKLDLSEDELEKEIELFLKENEALEEEEK